MFNAGTAQDKLETIMPKREAGVTVSIALGIYRMLEENPIYDSLLPGDALEGIALLYAHSLNVVRHSSLHHPEERVQQVAAECSVRMRKIVELFDNEDGVSLVCTNHEPPAVDPELAALTDEAFEDIVSKLRETPQEPRESER